MFIFFNGKKRNAFGQIGQNVNQIFLIIHRLGEKLTDH